MAQALHQIPDGRLYQIVSLDKAYPVPCTVFGRGNDHTELKHDLEELMGQRVGIGINPFDYAYEAGLQARPEEVFNPTVHKNQNYHAPYEQEPERYQWIEDLWGA